MTRVYARIFSKCAFQDSMLCSTPMLEEWSWHTSWHSWCHGLLTRWGSCVAESASLWLRLDFLQGRKITQKFMACHGMCACAGLAAHKNRPCMMQWCASKLMLGRQGQTEMNSLIVWTWYGSFAGHARRCWPWLGIPAGSRPEYWRNWDFTDAVITNGQRIEKSNIGYPNCQELVHDREKTSVSMCYQYFKGTYGLNDLTHLTTGRLGQSVQSGVFCPFGKRTCKESESSFFSSNATWQDMSWTSGITHLSSMNI